MLNPGGIVPLVLVQVYGEFPPLTLTQSEYDVPTVPFLKVQLIVSVEAGRAFIVSGRVFVTLPAEFVAVIFTLNEPDALGVPVEFSSRSAMKRMPVTGMRGNGTWDQPIGTWSDDTSLTIAAMESIARLKKIDKVDVMKNFVRWLYDDEFNANDKTFDCGNTTGRAIDNFATGASPETCGLTDENSNGNGSLMRIFPAIFYAYAKAETDDDALKIVHEFSALTHAHEISQMSCGIYYLIAAQILDEKNLADAVKIGLQQAKDFYSRQEKFFSRQEIFCKV